jgi:succinate dehydrogenase/fumarate reductase flavoprotein subunit
MALNLSPCGIVRQDVLLFCPSAACVTKLFPTRSHTVAAQGGINAALGNMTVRVSWQHVRTT